MKRAELKAGEEYVVAAPSVQLDGSYTGAHKRVRVLDPEPVWSETYIGWRSHSTLPKVKVLIEGRSRHVPDKTELATVYRASEAKRSVRVLTLINTRYGGWHREKDPFQDAIIEVVPISQVRMTWAEFLVLREQAEREKNNANRRRRDAERAEEALKADRQRRKDKLNELLAGTGLVAEVHDSKVVITGPPQDLLDAAGLVANA